MSELTLSEVTIQNRKFAKTCVEKKRRDRINKCLEELKDLIVHSNDKARYQKLEKAEILELAVNYVKSLKKISNQSYKNISFYSNDVLNENCNLILLQQFLNDFETYIKSLIDVKEDFKFKIITYINQRFDQLLVSLDDSCHFKNTKLKQINFEDRKDLKSPPFPRYSPYHSYGELKNLNSIQNSIGTDVNNSNIESIPVNYNAFFLLSNNNFNVQNKFKQYLNNDSNTFKNSILTSVCLTRNETKIWRPW